MKFNSRRSPATLLLISVLLFPAWGETGSTGTADAEMERVQDEAAAAQNSYDAELLKPGAKRTDAKVKEKAATLEEKTRALRDEFRKRTQPSAPARVRDPYVVDSDGRDDRSTEKTPDPAAVSRPRESLGNISLPSAPVKSESKSPDPGATLTADGVKSEITYEKKPARGSLPTHSTAPDAAEPVSVAAPSAMGDGISEIQYSKKPGKKLTPKGDASPTRR